MHDVATKHLAAADRHLGALIRQVGACTLFRHPPKHSGRNALFCALCEAIIFQQLHGKAATAILGRFKAIYPRQRFPTPAELLSTSDDRLRAAGLSRGKMAALRDIAARTLDGTIPSTHTLGKLSDAEIVERLTVARGVGPWTAEMILMFTLGRADVLPATDFGVRKGFAILYKQKEMPSPRELLAHGEKWRPYRSVAAWYLWRAAELVIDF